MHLADIPCRSIGESLVSMKNLKAVQLSGGMFDTDNLAPLGGLKNMRHLDLNLSGEWGGSVNSDVMQLVLRNSRSTLEGLVLYQGTPLRDFSPDQPADNKSYYLSALKSLTICGVEINAEMITALRKAINWISLRELTLQYTEDENCLFLPFLTSLTTSALTTNTPIHLRSLKLLMSCHRHWAYTDLQQASDFRDKCAFVSSFHTLTTLDLPDYGQYPAAQHENPGLVPLLLNGILGHAHLRTLKISYAGVGSQNKIPFLNAPTIDTIVSGLPELRDFEFAPEEAQMVRQFFPSMTRFHILIEI
jgi:hypothetical protein